MALSRLELGEVEREPSGDPPRRARAVPRLQGPLTQPDVLVDGVSVLQRAATTDPPGETVWTRRRFVSVADLNGPGESPQQVRRLAGWQLRHRTSDALEPGRLPLYVCPLCGDLYCGAPRRRRTAGA